MALKYLSGPDFSGLQQRESPPPSWMPHLDCHLCPPASVDEGADRLVRPRSTCVEVGAVPGFYQPHKVGTFPLQGEEFVSAFVPPVKADVFLKEQDVNNRAHLSSFSCHLTFPFSLGGCRPVNLGFQQSLGSGGDNRADLRELGEVLRTMSGSLFTLCMSKATRYSLLPRYRRPWSWSIRRMR